MKVADESRANLRALGLAGGQKPMQAGPILLTSVEILDAVIAAGEAAAESYLEFADSASDEGAVMAAHQLSASAIARLVTLRQRRGELPPVEFEDEPAAALGAPSGSRKEP